MKKLSLYIIFALTLASSCNYLDVRPQEITTENDIYSKMSNAEQVLANLYARIPTTNTIGITSGYFAATDMALNHWEGPVQRAYNLGSWSTDNNPYGDWYAMYDGIRQATVFMNKIEDVPIPRDREGFYRPRVPRFKAEARFLRAYFYFLLFKRYGAVPIIKNPLPVTNSSKVKLPRQPVDKVVNFIASQCDSAAALLPRSYEDDNKGRITKGAAMALKARTLLFAASPLFNGNKMYSGIKNPDGTQLFPQTYDKEKWKKAADAAKAVIDLGAYHMSNPYPNNPVRNYAQLFYTRNYTENILYKTLGDDRTPAQYRMPNGNTFAGFGQYSPLQELIDAYDMKNGLPIEDTKSGYQEDGFWDGKMWDGKKMTQVTQVSNMYKNRDPRFYATIYFNRGVWVKNTYPRALIYSYYGNNNGDVDGWPKPGTSSQSGYNIRKYINPDVDLPNGQGTGHRNCILIRLGGVYLDYAEALNEYSGPSQQVYDAVNKVRERVNMPDLPISGRADDQTQDGLRKRIHNERRIELAFENHRFFDVRRWMIAEDVDDGPVHGLNAQPTQQELEATNFPPGSKQAGEAVFYKRTVIQNRVFQDKHYLMPIPKNEVDINPNMVQNYGW